ncbi:HAD family hydrolase [Abditibacterium utsteinense]|nr:HAD family hydrolase [Abditibacterium utsteinense]
MIFFDLDDTLLDHRGAQDRAVLAWRRRLGPALVPHSEKELPAVWHAATVRHWAAYARGEISFAGQRRRRIRDVLRAPQLSDAQADEFFALYLPLYEANWEIFPDVWPCLERLNAQKLGILTHGDTAQQLRKLDKFALTPRFEVVVVLDEGGPRKPSRAAFETAAQKAGVSAPDCLYIGDQIEIDVLSARAAGWRGVWLDRSDVMVAPDGIERITSLLDVSFLLG